MNFLKKRKFCSFTYLNIAQFLGVLNDNLFKLLIVFFLIDELGQENSPRILASAGAAFVIPFLIFSNTAGKWADRFSKRNIIVLSKALEVLVMLLGSLCFYVRAISGSYVILFLMALQSAIFSPSKQGIVPEIVGSDRITKANGLLTSFSILGMILGTCLASIITDLSGRHFIIASSSCCLIALIGFLASLNIEYTAPVGNKKKLNPFFFYEAYKTLCKTREENRLFSSVLAAAYFLFLAAFIQLNMIPFCIDSLHLSDVQGGYLFVCSSLGIGLGSILAARLSRPHVELGLVPLGGIGAAISCASLHLFQEQLPLVIFFIFLMGFCGGVFEVPLESFIQSNSPEKSRGQIIASCNFLGFIGVLAASAFLELTTQMGLRASESFVFAGLITLGISLAFLFASFDYFLRFLAFCFSRSFFRLSIKEDIRQEEKRPLIIFIDRPSSWIDAILLTAIQKPPLRFFVESKNLKSTLGKYIFQLLHVVFIDNLLSQKRKDLFVKEVKNSLEKDYSVCIFAKSSQKELWEEIKQSLTELPYPIIPVRIEEKERRKNSSPYIFSLYDFPWPVNIEIGPPSKNLG